MACRGEYLLVTTSCPDKKSAKMLARLLVDEKLAACVQIFPIESVYFWDGETCDENEVLMLIKSKSVLYERLQTAIWRNHPYKVPEIIQLPITGGLPAYMKWIDETLDR
ncbi:MAG: divalent-cation tolerance protein CutA [Oscillospiraceae bacterium]|nr:divalent-cation tolerance protein CutA [Oscillospiraceae bacterium]